MPGHNLPGSWTGLLAATGRGVGLSAGATVPVREPQEPVSAVSFLAITDADDFQGVFPGVEKDPMVLCAETELRWLDANQLADVALLGFGEKSVQMIRLAIAPGGFSR
ncbi:MAG: hypothetical protein WBW33_02705 [Bryobacteraceae bacterium]